MPNIQDTLIGILIGIALALIMTGLGWIYAEYRVEKSNRFLRKMEDDLKKSNDSLKRQARHTNKLIDIANQKFTMTKIKKIRIRSGKGKTR
jgi:hypothetical protein